MQEHKTLYDIMLWNKSLIMDYLFFVLSDILLVKLDYLNYFQKWKNQLQDAKKRYEIKVAHKGRFIYE